MSRRKENIRKACDEIDFIVNNCLPASENLTAIAIKTLTHRIKRTTWRGEKDGHRPELRLACTCKTCSPTKPIAKKNKWNKDWDKYNNAKRINTNQTTTANVDVSTIPYY